MGSGVPWNKRTDQNEKFLWHDVTIWHRRFNYAVLKSTDCIYYGFNLSKFIEIAHFGGFRIDWNWVQSINVSDCIYRSLVSKIKLLEHICFFLFRWRYEHAVNIIKVEFCVSNDLSTKSIYFMGNMCDVWSTERIEKKKREELCLPRKEANKDALWKAQRRPSNEANKAKKAYLWVSGLLKSGFIKQNC